jgi:hypothetical protein
MGKRSMSDKAKLGVDSGGGSCISVEEQNKMAAATTMTVSVLRTWAEIRWRERWYGEVLRSRQEFSHILRSASSARIDTITSTSTSSWQYYVDGMVRVISGRSKSGVATLHMDTRSLITLNWLLRTYVVLGHSYRVDGAVSCQ